MTSEGFVHVLSTRVGIGVYDEAWFDYRLRLFEAITVPSIAAQTSQDFTWLLVVDRNMPPVARRRFNQAIAGLGNAVVVPVEFKSDFRAAVVRWSRDRATSAGAAYVMTSRLDDDDALRVDAFERLQGEADEFIRASHHRFAVFSLSLGCMWLPSRRLGYTRYHDSHSLGLSLVEPVEECQSVYSKPHREIKHQFAPRGTYVRSIDGDPLWWLYTTHHLSDSETGNRKRIEKIVNHKYGYQVDDSILTSFGLDPAVIGDLGRLAEPEPAAPTKFLSLRCRDTEREIKRLRQRMWQLAGSNALERLFIRARIRLLERRRLSAGSGIVRDRRDRG